MFYLTSLTWDAALIGRTIRTHWGIENQLHWVLDVTWGEDKSRIRRGGVSSVWGKGQSEMLAPKEKGHQSGHWPKPA
jgi:predicted transposase YbfD/YdcC